jgi:hypothetical protein
MTDAVAPPPPSIKYERAENFTSWYANSVLHEASAWDLKFIFGQIDQTGYPTTTIKQQLAVTIPWPQAKLILFWLRFQVEFAEATVGVKIPIRKDLLPADMPPLKPEEESDPAIKQAHDLYVKIRNEFLATV